MKLKLATILFAVSVMISAMTSCSKENLGEAQLPPLAGEVVLTDVLATDGSRVAPNYILEVEFGTEGATKEGSGAVLYVKFVSNAPTLAAGKYTEASASTAISGNFITGAEGTKLYLNGKEYLVTAGTIEVKNDDTSYSLSAIVKLSNGENYSLKCAGVALEWTGLPVMKVLNTVMSAQSNLANGTKSITLNLGDGNFTSEMDMTTYQTVYKGAGNYLAIDLYSEDGYLAAGTYKPSAQGGVINKGEYGIGWDPGDIYNVGMEFENWGTCWWTVDETATPQASAEKILTGDITVSLAGKVYTITVDNGELYAQFVGEIPAVTKPDAPATPPTLLGEYPYVIGISDQYEQYKSVVVVFASTDKLTSTGMGYSGTGKALNLTINAVKEGDQFYIPTGEYAVNLEGAENPFTWQGTGGMDLSEYGMGYMYWGTYMSDVVDGTSTVTELKDGTIWVGAKDGDYILHMNTQGKEFLIYQGKINGLTTPADDDGGYVEPEQPEEGGEGGACGCDCDGCKDCTGGGEGGDEPEVDNGIMLTQFVSFTDYKTQNGINLIGMELAGPGLTITQEQMSWGDYTWMQTVIKGSGNHLKIEFYSEDGKLAPGTYTAAADPAALQPGEFGPGYDYVSDWGTSIYGSTWTTYADDQIAAQEKVADGTVTVAEDGGIYTIRLQSSTVTTTYIGPLQ